MNQCINKATKKPKKTFKTFEDAVNWAKRMNENPKFIHKQVAYKCKDCLRFHIGRSQHNTDWYMQAESNFIPFDITDEQYDKITKIENKRIWLENLK